VRTVRAAADADPAAREVYREIEERRLYSIRMGMEMMAARGVIERDRVEDTATMLGLLVSNDTYLHFRDAGWSPERYQAWLRGQLMALVAAGGASS